MLQATDGYCAGSSRRIAMQNDLDLTRKIFESVRARNDLWPRAVEIAGYEPLVVSRHVERLYRDGMLDGKSEVAMSDQVSEVMVTDLTTAGHRFLAAMESGDVWARLKSALNPSELAALSFKELAGIAGELTMRAVRKKLGLD